MPSLEAHATPIMPCLGQFPELPGLSRSISWAICMSYPGTHSNACSSFSYCPKQVSSMNLDCTVCYAQDACPQGLG